MDTNVMDEELIVQDNTSANLDESGSGSHGSDYIEQEDINTGINVVNADTSHSDYVYDPLTDPPPEETLTPYKDFEQTSGIRYVAEGNTGEELEKLRTALEQAEKDEQDALTTPKSNILYVALGAIAYLGFM
jgi:hypothetical protein